MSIFIGLFVVSLTLGELGFGTELKGNIAGIMLLCVTYVVVKRKCIK